jgi:hypothetical protein
MPVRPQIAVWIRNSKNRRSSPQSKQDALAPPLKTGLVGLPWSQPRLRRLLHLISLAILHLPASLPLL